MNNEDALKQINEILDEHGIELRITARHDNYYAPHVIFRYKDETLFDDQLEFNNIKGDHPDDTRVFVDAKVGIDIRRDQVKEYVKGEYQASLSSATHDDFDVRWYTVAEASAEFNIPKGRIYRAIEKGLSFRENENGVKEITQLALENYFSPFSDLRGREDEISELSEAGQLQIIHGQRHLISALQIENVRLNEYVLSLLRMNEKVLNLVSQLSE